MVKHLYLHGLPPWSSCDREAFEEGDWEDREIIGLVRPVES